jgi:outer membrane protein assembly factor BamB
MQFLTNKAKTAAVITIALLMASVTLMAMPAITVQAQLEHVGNSPIGTPGMPNLGPLPAGVTPQYTIVSKAYLSFRPNPIGVGQSLLVNMWTSPGMYHSFYMQGYTVTIQKPDGTTVTVGPTNSYLGDATAWFEYIVDQAGTWKLKFDSPGTYLPVGNYTDRPGSPTIAYYYLGASVYYTASSTDWQELTVQQNMVASWPPAPLPTDYWTRPVNPMFREWYPILGSYPFTGTEYYYPGGRVLYSSNYKYTAYVQAPNTGHVVWKRLSAMSGLIGGVAYTYAAISTPSTPSIIYAGRCYQTVTEVKSTLINGTYYDQPQSVWQCYDLRTGEVYWEQTGITAPPTLVEYTPPSPSTTVAGEEAQFGYAVSLMTISSRLLKYNPYTGAVTLNVSIAPMTSGTYYKDNYALSVQTITVGANTTYRLINWTTAGTSTNFTSRVASNITWPRSSLGTVDYDAGLAVSCSWNTPPGPQWCIGNVMQSVDLYTGRELWTYSTNDTLSENVQNPTSFVVDRGKCAFGAHGRHWTCWDARTGKKLWESEQTEYPWGAWWPYSTASYDFNETKGAIIALTYEGVYAIDWDNGKILWHYTDPNAVPFENPYDATPYFGSVDIADGKVYTYNTEHTVSYPYARDWKIHCINATTGKLVWKMLNPMVPGAVADGYLTAGNSYDGYMYVFGKGKSATTVTAPDVAVPQGTGVVIKGTVLDMSPAQPSTPCVSAASMETQMEYLHLQMPITGLWGNETITGVPVILTAIGSDGTVIDITTTTTNGYYGTFGYTWTPPKEDTYTITATFAGDDSYGRSSAATTLSVGPAPASPTPTPTQPQTAPDNTGLLYAIMAAVIVAIIIGIIAILVALRKR